MSCGTMLMLQVLVWDVGLILSAHEAVMKLE